MANTVCSEPHAHLIGPDGGLRHITQSKLIPELERLGFRQVVNPKRTWYAEFDKTHPSYQEQILLDPNEDTHLLQVERV